MSGGKTSFWLQFEFNICLKRLLGRKNDLFYNFSYGRFYLPSSLPHPVGSVLKTGSKITKYYT